MEPERIEALTQQIGDLVSEIRSSRGAQNQNVNVNFGGVVKGVSMILSITALVLVVVLGGYMLSRIQASDDRQTAWIQVMTQKIEEAKTK